MAISQGTRLGSCEIVEVIGSGGMGEVWRGRDTALGREVAVKALPASLAHDPELLERLDREARVLAALNHPNLAIIHELKEAEGSKYLILELVEGETLADRIARGPIPLNDALEIAVQIARGVQAAHDKGVVHRDLKPANVKITPEGRVKVLDFGLAKIYEPTQSPQNLSDSPTVAEAETADGVILGTAAYMSPEQARGKQVDRRADVWGFGCLLYEMLTGRQPFQSGETLSDTLAGILVHDPDWKSLPAATPPRIRALIERCLRKDERRRIRDIGDARIAIEETRSEFEATAAAAVAATTAGSRRREMAFAGLAIVFLLSALGVSARMLLQASPSIPTVHLDTPVSLGVVNSFYLSPDGRKLAFVTRPAAGARIWVRSLDSAAPEPIPSTDGIATPNVGVNVNSGENNNLFWSADSQYVAFVAEDKLKKVAATGGPAQVLATLPHGGNYFGAWNQDGVILLSSDSSNGGPLLRLSATGKLEPITELDKSRKEQSHRYPHFLPDGRHYLYLAMGGDARDRTVYVGALDSKERRALPGIAGEVKYSSGHLIFVRDGALMAQPFDAKRLELTGEAFALADKFAPPASLSWSFSASVNGVLAFRASGDATAANAGNMELVWYDRKGIRLSVAATENEFIGPELSPDGKFVAFARGMPPDIWWLDIDTKRQTKLTDIANDGNPRWSPDGKFIAFDSTREGASGIYIRPVGVTGTDKLVLKAESGKNLTLSDWSPDGKYLAYVQDNDVWALPVSNDSKSGEAKPIQVTKTSYIESLPRISPDSHWIAYVSNKSQRTEVYIQSFPEPGAEQLVSNNAGGNTSNAQPQPRWSRDGKELFYFLAIRGSGFAPGFLSVSIKPQGAALNAQAPAQVISHPAPRQPFSSVFSVTHDSRFLLQVVPTTTAIGAAGTTAGNAAPAATNGITVIVNWAGTRR